MVKYRTIYNIFLKVCDPVIEVILAKKKRYVRNLVIPINMVFITFILISILKGIKINKTNNLFFKFVFAEKTPWIWKLHDSCYMIYTYQCSALLILYINNSKCISLKKLLSPECQWFLSNNKFKFSEISQTLKKITIPWMWIPFYQMESLFY